MKLQATPLQSFIGFVDIKLGALLNKIAGVYGILAVFVGGTFAQLSMYAYSIATLAVFLWGLKSIAEEDPQRTLTFAHLFTLDHFLSTAWTVVFAVIWWYYTPHDGRRVANSSAQEEMMRIPGASAESEFADAAERAAAALSVWKSERGFAAVILVGTWFIKVYFALCLYSFALHLRRGTYHSLPLSRPAHSPAVGQQTRPGSNGYRYAHVRTTSTATTVPDGPIWDEELELDTRRSSVADR